MRRQAAHVHRGAPGPAKPHLRIDVIDHGAGIREADQATLFEAFREIQEPSGRRIGGLGLGLALARELIRAHGGDIWFVSKRGRGTTKQPVMVLVETGGKAHAHPIQRLDSESLRSAMHTSAGPVAGAAGGPDVPAPRAGGAMSGGVAPAQHRREAPTR